jgi:uncharacterized protein (TIGR00661 family)
MKILYAIQGTGNGHITRALHLVPVLKKKADVTVLLSGYQSDIQLPFKVDFKFHGLSFVFGKKGGIDYLATYKKSRIKKFYKEIKQLDVSKFDVVISDFEPISAWACYLAKKPCVGLSNQATLMSEGVPKPKSKDVIGKMILKNYAPCSVPLGFHYKKYNDSIFNPIIRNEIRKGKVSEGNYYLVYLPSYSYSRIERIFSKFPKVMFKVYSKHITEPIIKKNIAFLPVNQKNFTNDMLSCKGIICAAGFATTSEALFLGKKLLIIPQKGQLEQQYNKLALNELGVSSIKSLKEKHLDKIQKFLQSKHAVHIPYEDDAETIVNYILKNHKTWAKNYQRKSFKKPELFKLEEAIE